MQAVTCFQCGHATTIAPNHYLCSECGEDLQHLLLPETVAEYFRARAHDSSARGELGAALAEAERGLTYADSSELHLLAAILAKQLGRHDRMRQHVAAIPVDDSLRSEAEWLLRSHQDRARALQEAAWQSNGAYAGTSSPRAAAMPASSPAPHGPRPIHASAFLDELLVADAPEAPNEARTFGQVVASVVIVLVAVTMVAASWWWIGPGTLPSDDNDGDEFAAAGVPGDAATGAEVMGDASGGDTAPDGTVPQRAAVVPTPVMLLAATPTLALLPTATATPALANNLVQPPAETPELADADPSSVVVVESNIYDIRQYLRELGRVELAELTIDARLQGDTLHLQGFVHLDFQRRQLLEIAEAIPGVAQVSAVNLLLRPLPTYIVQEGDTLWSIVFNIYGDVNRLDEFAAHNRAVLPSPDALAPGMELRVLPVQ